MNMNGVIGYKEFKGLMECIGKDVLEDQFYSEILNQFQSTDVESISGEAGLTLKGLIQFFCY